MITVCFLFKIRSSSPQAQELFIPTYDLHIEPFGVFFRKIS